jgi:hypothetical protein
MKCPCCVAEGQRSRVTVLSSSRNAVYVPTVYDEEGRLIPGWAGGSTSYSCSRGHRWTDKQSPGIAQFMPSGAAACDPPDPDSRTR